MYNQTAGWVPVEIMSFYQALMWKKLIISLEVSIHSVTFMAGVKARARTCRSAHRVFWLPSILWKLIQLPVCCRAFRNSTFLPFNFRALGFSVGAETEGEESVTSRPVSRHMMSASGWSDQIPNLLHCLFCTHDGFWKNAYFPSNCLTKLNDSSPRCEIFPDWKPACASGLFSGHFTHLLLCRLCTDTAKQIRKEISIYCLRNLLI